MSGDDSVGWVDGINAMSLQTEICTKKTCTPQVSWQTAHAARKIYFIHTSKIKGEGALIKYTPLSVINNK